MISETVEKAIKSVEEGGKSLILREEKINIMEISLISELAKNLHTLCMPDSQIGDIAVIEMMPFLYNNNALNKLDLSGNKISGSGASSIAKMLLFNNTLTTLNVSKNDICDLGGVSIASALLSNRVLRKIRLFSNDLGVNFAKKMAEVIKVNTMLQVLNIAWNDIDEEGAVAIADAIPLNRTLKKLSMPFNDLGVRGVASMNKAMLLNDTLLYAVYDCQSKAVASKSKSLIWNIGTLILRWNHYDHAMFTFHDLMKFHINTDSMICVSQNENTYPLNVKEFQNGLMNKISSVFYLIKHCFNDYKIPQDISSIIFRNIVTASAKIEIDYQPNLLRNALYVLSNAFNFEYGSEMEEKEYCVIS